MVMSEVLAVCVNPYVLWEVRVNSHDEKCVLNIHTVSHTRVGHQHVLLLPMPTGSDRK